MIITFARLCRLSGGLSKPSAVKAWLKREGINYIRDKDGRPWTTLDALNRKLQRAGNDGFTLDDPEGGLPEERPVVSGRPKQVDRAVQGGRGAGRSTSGAPRYAYQSPAGHGGRAVSGVLTTGGNQRDDAP